MGGPARAMVERALTVAEAEAMAVVLGLEGTVHRLQVDEKILAQLLSGEKAKNKRLKKEIATLKAISGLPDGETT